MYFPKFVERNVQLIGLSIDSVYAQLGWVYNIYKATGIEIPFPIIADLDMKIAKKYGMISPTLCTTSTVRSVFIIDDKQIIRAILQYPNTTGRYIPEILRIIDSLQTTDCQKVATPANWLPGLPVLEPAPTTYEGLKDRLTENKDLCCVDWYLCFKEDKKKKCFEQKAMPMMETKCVPKPIECPKPMPIEMPKPIECPKPVPIEVPKPIECPKPMPIEVPKPIECPKPMPIEKPKPIEVCPPPKMPVPVEKPVEIEKIPIQKAPIQKAPIQKLKPEVKIKGKG